MELAAVVTLVATNDRFVLSANRQLLAVLTNDQISAGTTIVSVSQPSSGSAEIVGDKIQIALDDTDGEVQVLSYTISNGQLERTAEITVVQLGLASKFIEAALIAKDDVDSSASEEARSITQNLGLVISEPAALIALTDLEFPLLRFSFAASMFGALLGWFALRRRKRKFATVRGVRRRDQLISVGARPFSLRHNAEPLWLTGRTRPSGQVEVETRNGRKWILRENLEGL